MTAWWAPVKHVTFLGYDIHTDISIIKIPEDRLKKVLSTIGENEFYISKFGKVHYRLVASLIGGADRIHVLCNWQCSLYYDKMLEY